MIKTPLFCTNSSGAQKVNCYVSLYVICIFIVCDQFPLALNSFISVLDERRATRPSQSGNVAKKNRRIGKPSLSLPPVSAPEWAVCRSSDSLCHTVGYILVL